ncbi:VOC family protein [Pengzhenrongella sp.]|jgi:PhnB protein|uniref:VOC family protein n=1 Tax=Pengzhenrongella sp. TaxID=2888820 RepID=UPI002F941A9D
MTSNERVVTSLAPWLSVSDGPTALAYYQAAFGAVERYRLEDDGGRVVVAQLAIGPADFWLQEEPDFRRSATGGGPIRMILTVDDPDAAFQRALDADAIQISPVADGHGWRIGRLVDPWGHHWEVGRPAPDVTS